MSSFQVWPHLIHVHQNQLNNDILSEDVALVIFFFFNCFFSRSIVSHRLDFCSSELVALLQPARATQKKSSSVRLRENLQLTRMSNRCGCNHHFLLYNLRTSIPSSSGVSFYIHVQSCHTPHHLK